MNEATAGKSRTTEGSSKAKALSARLMAVQAYYQAVQNAQTLESALEEYLQHRVGMEDEGEVMVPPDGALLSRIVRGVQERRPEIEELVTSNLSNKSKEPELLLRGILVCAAYELMAHADIDAPIIINDYLNVAHGFFGQGEVNLVNAVSDKLSKAFRLN